MVSVSPQTLIDTFASIDNHTLSDAILKSSLRRVAHNNIHNQLILARSLLFPHPPSSPSSHSRSHSHLSPSPSSPSLSASSTSFSPFSLSHPVLSTLYAAPVRFSFGTRTGRLEWGQIEGLDLDKIFREGSIEKIEPLVGNIAFSEVAVDPFVKYATPEFIKAFNVSQMLIQYLNFQSETLVARILQMNDEYVQLTAGHDKEKKVLQERDAVKAEEVELLKKHIQKVTDELQTILKEYTKLDQLVKKYSKKCPVCDRLFFQPINLEKHILQRHPTVTQNLEVQALMEDFAKLVGPSSDIYRSEKMKLEQSLQEIQKLKATLIEETRRIQEKDALIEKKLEASLLGQERERKYTETLQEFERARQEQEKRTEEELRNLQQTLGNQFQEQIQQLKESMQEEANSARQEEVDRITKTFEAQIDKLTAQMQLQLAEYQRKLTEEREERERLQEEHERLLDALKDNRDDALAQLQDSLKRKDESLSQEQQRSKQLAENQQKLENDLLMASKLTAQLQSELEKLKQKPKEPEPVPPIIIEPPPKPKPPPVQEEPEVFIPKTKEFTPLPHRPYLKTYFPYTAAEIAYYRNEILLALQREIEARNVEFNPKTGGITKKEKERLLLEVMEELNSKPDARDFNLTRTDVLREIDTFTSQYHSPPPSDPPSTPPRYPPTPPPLYPPTPPPNVTPTPFLSPASQPAAYSQPPATQPPVDDHYYYEEEEPRVVEEEEDELSSSSLPSQKERKRRPSIERDHSQPLRPIPEEQSPSGSFTLDPYSKSPVLNRKRIWRRSPNESDDAMVEMGVTDSQDSLALSAPESPSSSPTLKRRGASSERDKPTRVSPVSRFRRNMASDTSQQLQLMTELQKHNTYVANKNANKQQAKLSTKKPGTSNSTSKDLSDDAAYSDFEDDSYVEEETPKKIPSFGSKPKQRTVQ